MLTAKVTTALIKDIIKPPPQKKKKIYCYLLVRCTLNDVVLPDQRLCCSIKDIKYLLESNAYPNFKKLENKMFTGSCGALQF